MERKNLYRLRKSLICLAGAACFLLVSPAIAFSKTGDRRPVVAGQFYPGDAGALGKMVDGFIASADPVALPGELVAILVPHAGYVYSGQTAGYGFKRVRGPWKTVVLLGAAHRYRVRGAAVYSGGSFVTPLGKVPVDEKLCKKLVKASPLIEDLPEAHTGEHSLEVEIPFLQRTLKAFKIVPILMNTDDIEICRKVGESIAKVIRGKNALIVISSDLSHYPDRETARLVDLTTLKALERMDPEYFHLTSRFILSRGERDLSCTYCGEAALLAGLYASKALGANRAALLHYTNSGYIPKIGQASRAVGYASVAFVKSKKKPKAGFFLDREAKDGLLREARKSIMDGLGGEPYRPAALSRNLVMNLPAAVFVTLTKKGILRGCIGSTEPRMTLFEAVRYFARSAAFNDGRFTPVRKREMDDIHMEISILSPSEPIPSADEIIPKKHGVTVSKGRHFGIFLPTVWEHLPEKNNFLRRLCAEKAHLPPDCWKDPKTELRIFTTDVFEE